MVYCRVKLTYPTIYIYIVYMINRWVYITNFNQFIPHTKRGLIVTMVYLLSFCDFFPTKFVFFSKNIGRFLEKKNSKCEVE
jgi:hypothetical protein